MIHAPHKTTLQVSPRNVRGSLASRLDMQTKRFTQIFSSFPSSSFPSCTISRWSYSSTSAPNSPAVCPAIASANPRKLSGLSITIMDLLFRTDVPGYGPSRCSPQTAPVNHVSTLKQTSEPNPPSCTPELLLQYPRVQGPEEITSDHTFHLLRRRFCIDCACQRGQEMCI